MRDFGDAIALNLVEVLQIANRAGAVERQVLTPEAGADRAVLQDGEVGEDEGTGIVHIAPGCGAEDFSLGKEYNLHVLAPLDEFGVYVNGFGWLTGMNVTQVL